MNKTLFILIFFLFIIFINCNKCQDKSCIYCSAKSNYCYRCKEGFIRHYSHCGIKCNSIINCQLCTEDKTKCIKCKPNCIYNGILCDCTERYILIIVSIFIALSTIGITCLCLMNTSRVRSINMIFLTGHITPSIFNRSISIRSQLSEEINIEAENKINEKKIINDFNKNKIKEDKNIEKKKCIICKNNDCNLKLGCGCYICFGCEKICIKRNICLNCHQNISSMQQVSCSICLSNKKDISTFNCPCKTVICKQCYLIWRKKNNFCPSCRSPIFCEY